MTKEYKVGDPIVVRLPRPLPVSLGPEGCHLLSGRSDRIPDVESLDFFRVTRQIYIPGLQLCCLP